MALQGRWCSTLQILCIRKSRYYCPIIIDTTYAKYHFISNPFNNSTSRLISLKQCFQEHVAQCPSGPWTWSCQPGTRHFSQTNTSRLTRKLVLGIETSCDDTGAAVVDDDGNILGEALNSQTRLHVELGGIQPPIAKALHAAHIDEVVKTALSNANVSLQDVDAIAATVKPGISGPLRVGLHHAKQLVKESGKPFIPIHHMEAHALTARMIHRVPFPFLVLLISGGHCLLAVAKDVDEFLVLGTTGDEAPGDAFDKIARSLRLKNLPQCEGLSGGASVELVAKEGDSTEIYLPYIMGRSPDCNFSFAGIKTTVLRIAKRMEKECELRPGAVLPQVADLCASFQYVAMYHLAKRLQRAILFCELKELLPENNKTVVVSGGVACNNYIRTGLKTICQHYDCQLVCPPPKLCTDNGIMIAWNGMEKLKVGRGIAPDPDEVHIEPKCPLGEDLTEEVWKCSIKLKRIKLR